MTERKRLIQQLQSILQQLDQENEDLAALYVAQAIEVLEQIEHRAPPAHIIELDRKPSR